MADKAGVTFGNHHSYTAWGLRLKNIEIEVPEPVTNYIEVPGMDGELDLTEALTGEVRYKMRTLRFTFNARNCSYSSWATLISTISSAIHGQKLQIILDTDPDYYYTGRCMVSTSKSNEVTATVVIESYCEPYKTSVSGSRAKLL